MDAEERMMRLRWKLNHSHIKYEIKELQRVVDIELSDQYNSPNRAKKHGVTQADRDKAFTEQSSDMPARFRKGKIVQTSIQRLTEMDYTNHLQKKLDRIELKRKYSDFYTKMHNLKQAEQPKTEHMIQVERKRESWQRNFSTHKEDPYMQLKSSLSKKDLSKYNHSQLANDHQNIHLQNNLQDNSNTPSMQQVNKVNSLNFSMPMSPVKMFDESELQLGQQDISVSMLDNKGGLQLVSSLPYLKSINQSRETTAGSKKTMVNRSIDLNKHGRINKNVNSNNHVGYGVFNNSANNYQTLDESRNNQMVLGLSEEYLNRNFTKVRLQRPQQSTMLQHMDDSKSITSLKDPIRKIAIKKSLLLTKANSKDSLHKDFSLPPIKNLKPLRNLKDSQGLITISNSKVSLHNRSETTKPVRPKQN